MIDQQKKRSYRTVTASYERLIYDKLEKGRLEEEKFWRMQQKLSEWYRNYRPEVVK